MKQPLEIPLRQLRPAHHEPGQLVQNLIELNLVLIFSQPLVVAQTVPQLSLAIQQLIQIPQEQLQLANVTTLLITANTLHENLVNTLKTTNKVTVHILHLRVVSQQLSQVSVRMQVVIVTHKILTQKYTWIKTTTHLRINLLSVVHQLL